MKIEKINENKIRIILKQEDFKDKSIDLQKLLLTNADSQSLFLEILNRAEKEVAFDTNGHKLLIETYFQGNDICIFTITKYIEPNTNNKKKPKKYLTLKRKKQIFNNSSIICQFNQFEDFCDFCNFFYNNTYYLVIDGINLSHKSISPFFSSILEFSTLLKYTKNFKYKLKEHGKIFIKNNAINTGIKYFAYK